MLAPRSFDRNLNSTGVYGVGTYFAADARYSLQERYASTDSDGCQWVLLARVLVGQPCVGREGMKQPSRNTHGWASVRGNIIYAALEAAEDDLTRPEQPLKRDQDCQPATTICALAATNDQPALPGAARTKH